MNGVSSRTKARIRWYGNFFSEKNKYFFEIKKKEGFIVIKDSKKVSDLKLHPMTNLKEALRTCLGSDYKKHFVNYNNLNPKLVNSYKRKYFLSKDKNFRITIDSDQKIGSPKIPLSLKDLYINTLKHSRIIENGYQAHQIINGLSANSKYIDGVNFNKNLNHN